MSDTYIVYIENLAENTNRKLKLSSDNPMNAHKDAYMNTSRYEEISTISDANGKTVFDKSKGFFGSY